VYVYVILCIYIYAVQRGHWGELRTMPVEGAGASGGGARWAQVCVYTSM